MDPLDRWVLLERKDPWERLELLELARDDLDEEREEKDRLERLDPERDPVLPPRRENLLELLDRRDPPDLFDSLDELLRFGNGEPALGGLRESPPADLFWDLRGAGLPFLFGSWP